MEHHDLKIGEMTKLNKYKEFKNEGLLSLIEPFSSFRKLKDNYIENRNANKVIKDLINYYKEQSFNFYLISPPTPDMSVIYEVDNIKVYMHHDNLKIWVNRTELKCDGDLIYKLYNILSRIYNNTWNLRKEISWNIFHRSGQLIEMDRFEEFEVIKNNKIDYINLNRLYDFYEADFNEERVKEIVTNLIKNKK